MDNLPAEILLLIAQYLEPHELANIQLVSKYWYNVFRDNEIWKRLCFEGRPRRQHDIGLDQRLAELARAAERLIRETSTFLQDVNNTTAVTGTEWNETRLRRTLLANWDPTYPQEDVSFYHEYIQRHAPHTISWFQESRYGHEDDRLHHEATGAGILYDQGLADKLVAPMEDGSIAIWEASASHSRQGTIIAKGAIGLLPNRGSDLDYATRLRQSQAIMSETGTIECVSIDNVRRRGFFAVQNVLNEVDLATLQVVSRTPYPFPITALSEAHHSTPLTVGTNWTIHLHDTRSPPVQSRAVRTELIGGNPASSCSNLQTRDFGDHVSLSQPGALSILHLPTAREWDGNGDIWVGGRFTSMLNFDRRFFPRLRGTVHSGARLSCLNSIPFSLITYDVRSSRPFASLSLIDQWKELSGHTLIAAGEYKGKGSLELYNLSSDPARSINSSDSRTTQNRDACYQNRQTASRSKLLSVAPHGTRLVFSDGDGNLKWVERDGSTGVRQLNINEKAPDTRAGHNGTVEQESGDIVQKILPTVHARQKTDHSNTPFGKDNLIIWTGEGRLGMVGFGQRGFDISEMEDQAREAEAEELRKKEREYGGEMRRALEHQARELRWMRGYGL
ncbi:uncharacterized protein EI97DRAFT_404197 [Westerdykella ornata]|uniref:F-box domain-containing protein n=1 Tax=Westerdykella ornata TaxID=318751 RepID=A0A6A6J9W3_WESOR|nr:uncharacterized protein EI97DRAFT_404197 [Westerdykella ornata]KAF2273380.1 hypothetical protein EI97DRAFT_404197 [Westerdykella ornata]